MRSEWLRNVSEDRVTRVVPALDAMCLSLSRRLTSGVLSLSKGAHLEM